MGASIANHQGFAGRHDLANLRIFVELDGKVVRLLRDRLLGQAAGIVRRRAGADGEQAHLVDGGGLRARLGEPVAGGEGLELPGLHGFERAPVGLGQGGRRVRAAGRAEVEVDGAVELLARRLEMALLDVGHAGREVRVRFLDQAGDGIGGEGALGRGGFTDTAAVGASGGNERDARNSDPLPAPGYGQAPPQLGTTPPMVGKDPRILAHARRTGNLKPLYPSAPRRGRPCRRRGRVRRGSRWRPA